MAGPPPALTAVNELVGKADGKDKLLATVQYVLMLVAGGEAGMIKDLQGKVASARKVFRVMKPLEMLTPVLREPHLPGKKALYLELLPKLKALFMAAYFGFDHAVWFGSAGLIQDKTVIERCQKTSLYSWFLGSLCTIAQEGATLLQEGRGAAAPAQNAGESDEDWGKRRGQAAVARERRITVLVHAITQALLASGLLQLRPWKPRTTATFGVLASAINCYLIAPQLERYIKSWLYLPTKKVKVEVKLT